MNKRIRELREQAFDYVQYQLYTVGSVHPVMQAEQLEMINQKFAELIVNECLAICEELGDKGLDGHYCADKIARHFRAE